jgi:hypothetical protein
MSSGMSTAGATQSRVRNNRRYETRNNRPQSNSQSQNNASVDYIPPICVKIPKDIKAFFKTPEIQEKIAQSKFADHIRRAKFDKNRDVLLYPSNQASIAYLMNDDTDLFNKFKRSNIGSKENYPIMISNISLDEINNNNILKDLLNAKGLTDFKSVTASTSKLVKAFCATSLARENAIRLNEFEALFNSEKRIIRIEPCINVQQCFKCNRFGHIETSDDCPNRLNNATNCSNCTSRDHTFDACSATGANIVCVNCKKNHNAYDRSNCQEYNRLKSESIKIERLKILKIPDNETLKSTWTQISSYAPELKDLKNDIHEINKSKDSILNEISSQNIKIQSTLDTVQASNNLVLKAMSVNIENSKTISEFYASSIYVKNNNETNEKLNLVQDHIKFLYNTFLPNVQYKAIDFLTLAAPPVPSILTQQQQPLNTNPQFHPFNQVPSPNASNHPFENNTLHRK